MSSSDPSSIPSEPPAGRRETRARAALDEAPSPVGSLLRSDRTMLFFRNVGALAIATVACLVPEVGPMRFWLAATLVFVCVPMATWLELRFPASENAWSQPLFDLSMVILLVHLVPSMWFTALVIGLIVVQAPSVAESERGYFYYALFAALLTVGMTFAAIVHSVEGWALPILSMAVLYPSVIYYSFRQTTHANELRDRAVSLEGLRRVAGGVAHDFNNLLTAVLGNAELASLEIDDGHPAREPLADVVNGATRASMLTGRLLALSGRPGYGIVEFDLEEEIRELVSLLEPVVPTGVRLRIDSRLAGQRVRADRAKLQQLAMNLIVNASEALERRPDDVTITLQRVDDRDGDRVSILVRDRGVGIRAEDRDRIFDPFFTSKERGHGLGLANAREIARELGGELEIRSAPGRGTDATLVIPTTAQREQAAPPRVAPAAASGRAERLALVVDDEAEVREVATRMLSRLEYQAIEAEDGFRGIELFEAQSDAIELVVLDVRMPGMSGWQCLQRIRAIRDDVPVILCTGYDSREGSAREQDDGVVRLTKPYRIADLRAATAAIAAAQTPVAR